MIGGMTRKTYGGCRKARAVLQRYMNGAHGPAEHERARMDIQSIIESDREMNLISYRYFSEQLARIDRGEPVQSMLEWTRLRSE